jgi:hypothetical protein
VDNDLVKHGFSSNDKIFDDHVGGWVEAVGNMRRVKNITLNQCPVFPKCMLLIELK